MMLEETVIAISGGIANVCILVLHVHMGVTRGTASALRSVRRNLKEVLTLNTGSSDELVNN
jgi:predicted protein tyrosine phosphatase